MKYTYLSFLFLILLSNKGNYTVAQNLNITAQICFEAYEVKLTGPSFGWNPTAGPSAVNNEDGTWTFEIPTPSTNYEFLLVVDGEQENLIEEMVNGGNCAPITDYFSYANRLWVVGSGDMNITYGSCSECDPNAVYGCTDPNALNYDPNATEDDGSCEYEETILYITTTVCYEAEEVRMTGPWWNWDPMGGPIAVDNGDNTWTFTFDPAPNDDLEYLLVMDGVQENLIEEMVNGGTCAPITDYWAYANRLWLPGSGNVQNVYGTCGECDPNAIIGCTDPLATNYDPNATIDDGSCYFSSITITTTVCDEADNVRMTGPLWDWDPSGGPEASDNGDGTWTFTFDPAPSDDMEYLLVVDGEVEDLIQVMIDGGDCAPITDYSTYANRYWETNQGSISNIFGQCVECGLENGLNIHIDLCGYEANEVRITGPAWGWDVNNGVIGSNNGDGTWTVNLSVPDSNMEFLIVADGVQENLIQDMVEGGTCAPITDYWAYANRIWNTSDPYDIYINYDRCVPCSFPNLSVTAEICEPANVSEVKLVGPPNWDWNNGKTGINNGDGTWTFNYEPVPAESIEYLVYVDGVGEDLIQEMIEGATCAPLTDLYEYANRQWVISDGEEIFVTYNTCLNCDGTENVSELGVHFGIYPNPVSDQITIIDVPSNFNYSIFSSLGQKIEDGSKNNTIDVSQLEPGIYFLVIQAENWMGQVPFVKE